MLTLPNQNCVDSINDSNGDSINIRDDKLNDFDLTILQMVQSNPGISTRSILESLKVIHPGTTIFDIKNSFKRRIHGCVEYGCSKRNGGYFIKKKKHSMSKPKRNSLLKEAIE